MQINLGPSVEEIRQRLMQEALDKFEAKHLAGHPKLVGVLGIHEVEEDIKPKWKEYASKMVKTYDAPTLRKHHDDFLTQEELK